MISTLRMSRVENSFVAQPTSGLGSDKLDAS